MLCLTLAACNTVTDDQAEIGTKTKFASAEYGVEPSPRVTKSKDVKKGGGRRQVGKAYMVKGKWYRPHLDPDYDKVGMASWYGPNFHGRLTANGETYDQNHLSAAHPTLPLPSYARVTNEKNGNSVIVRINDRGPFAPGRIIDLSSEAAKLLAMRKRGVAKVRVSFVGMAPVDGDDTPMLMASYRKGGAEALPTAPATGVSDVMVAMNGTQGKQDSETQGLPGVTASNDASDSAAPAGGALALNGQTAPSQAERAIAKALLPDVGPVPADRPSLVGRNDGAQPQQTYTLASAYAESRVETASSIFDRVLTGGPPAALSADAIVQAWARQLWGSR